MALRRYNRSWKDTTRVYFMLHTSKECLSHRKYIRRKTASHLQWSGIPSILEPEFKKKNATVWAGFVAGPIEHENKIWNPLWGLEGFNPLNPELNPICYLLALLAHHFLHVSRIRVKSLTIRLLMSYIYIWSVIYIYIYGAPILDVSRSHTTTQHSW